MKKLLLFTPLFSGCAALEMAQTWQLDRLRVLGAQSVPAEPQPGETVTLRSITYFPSEQPISVVWIGCLGDDATSFGCTLDPALIDSLNTPPDDPAEQLSWYLELQEAGLLGIEPDVPPTWSIPSNALDNLEDEEKEEGVSAFMNLTAIPSEMEDDDELELVYKRLPVSLNAKPNQNPTIEHIVINNTEYVPTETLTVPVNGELTLDIQFEQGAVEEYSYTNPDTGITENRTETPYISWYTEFGSFSSFVSLLPNSEVIWTAPNFETQTEIIATVRDRRGGMDWIRLTLVVEAP